MDTSQLQHIAIWARDNSSSAIACDWKDGARMRISIYKRTHMGDPCECGIFGSYDCMGEKRKHCLNYDAVIGVAGSEPDRGSEQIAGRLTWVGIGPRQLDTFKRGLVLSFDHFNLLNEDGPKLSEQAPKFWEWVKELKRGFRDSNNLPLKIRSEVVALVTKFRGSSPSPFEMGGCQCKSGRCSYSKGQGGNSSSNSDFQSSSGKRSCK
ncbi:MAG: hypothetical protein F4Y89_11440 [Gammaproteobacteria bacterium]|nr:hypothetical protein [Gammaproteobacteria bacterium]MYG97513.1 hypothetical protein [Gammaproteobacteria bacterium]